MPAHMASDKKVPYFALTEGGLIYVLSQSSKNVPVEARWANGHNMVIGRLQPTDTFAMSTITPISTAQAVAILRDMAPGHIDELHPVKQKLIRDTLAAADAGAAANAGGPARPGVAPVKTGQNTALPA